MAITTIILSLFDFGFGFCNGATYSRARESVRSGAFHLFSGRKLKSCLAVEQDVACDGDVGSFRYSSLALHTPNRDKGNTVV